jgi:cytoskeleton protein RodZ
MSKGNQRQVMEQNRSVGKRRLHLREVVDGDGADDDGARDSSARDGDDENRDAGYDGVGRDLRSARLKSELEPAEVAVQLHIRQSYIQAIEDGRFEQLPASVYAYGFVRSYAELMGLDEDLIVRRFKNEWEGLGTSTRLAFPEPPEEIRLPRGPLITASCLLAIAIYGGWYTLSKSEKIDVPRVAAVPERLAEAVAPADVDVETVTAEPVSPAPVSPEPVSKEPAPSDTTPIEPKLKSHEAAVVAPPPPVPVIAEVVPDVVAPEVPVTVAAAPEGQAPTNYGGANEGRVTLRARADTWVRVQADEDGGQVYLARILHLRDEFRLPNRADLFLMTGNAGGLEILVDGKKVADIGELGVVRRRVLLDPKRLLAGTAVDQN